MWQCVNTYDRKLDIKFICLNTTYLCLMAWTIINPDWKYKSLCAVSCHSIPVSSPEAKFSDNAHSVRFFLHTAPCPCWNPRQETSFSVCSPVWMIPRNFPGLPLYIPQDKRQALHRCAQQFPYSHILFKNAITHATSVSIACVLPARTWAPTQTCAWGELWRKQSLL